MFTTRTRVPSPHHSPKVKREEQEEQDDEEEQKEQEEEGEREEESRGLFPPAGPKLMISVGMSRRIVIQ